MLDRMESSSVDSLSNCYADFVIEVASKLPRGEARAFAQHYLQAKQRVSKLDAAAMRLEALIIGHEELGQKFLETITDRPESFVVVFVGDLSQDAVDRAVEETKDYLSWGVLVRAGERTVNGDVSDLTIFELSLGTTEEIPRVGVRRPEDETAPATFGKPRTLRTTVEGLEEGEKPPGLTTAGSDGRSCEVCVYYDGVARNCVRFDWAVDPGDVCRFYTLDRVVGPVGPDPYGDDAADEEDADGLYEPYLRIGMSEGVLCVATPRHAFRVEPTRGAVEVLREVVDGLKVIYADMPDEGNLALQVALEEFGEDWGEPAPDLIVEDVDDEIEERDARIARRSRRRLAEKNGNGGDVDDEEPLTTDRTDDPEFYRDDLQMYYDAQIGNGRTREEALASLRKQFKLSGKKIIVTPIGEVRVKGVVDDPSRTLSADPADAAAAAAAVGAPTNGGSSPERPPPSRAPAGGVTSPTILQVDPGGVTTTAVEQIIDTWLADGGPSSGRLPAPVRLPESRAWDLWTDAAVSLQRTDPDRFTSPRRWTAQWGIFESLVQAAIPQASSIEDAWEEFVTYEDCTLDQFATWLERRYPSLVSELSGWEPREATSSSMTEELSSSRCEVWEKWKRLSNIDAQSLWRFYRSGVVREALKGRRDRTAALREARGVSAVLLRLKTIPVEEWGEAEWRVARRANKAIDTLRRKDPSQPLVSEGLPTRRLIALRAWGHDPLRVGSLSEAEFFILQRPAARCVHCGTRITESTDVTVGSGVYNCAHCSSELVETLVDDVQRRRANRLIDAMPGLEPKRIASLDEAPEFKTLKAHRVDLTDDERKRVLSRKAVWHFGSNGPPSPAVWKSVVGDKTWFVTNTHRAFNVAASLDGAIGRYHAFIKSTA
jgi:hypothetical protein